MRLEVRIGVILWVVLNVIYIKEFEFYFLVTRSIEDRSIVWDVLKIVWLEVYDLGVRNGSWNYRVDEIVEGKIWEEKGRGMKVLFGKYGFL